MLICPYDIFSSTTVMLLVLPSCCWYYRHVVGTSFHFEAVFSTQPINLVVEEISQNKFFLQTPIIYFINQKEKHVSIQHNSMLTLMKSGALFFRINIIYMIFLM